MSMLQAEYAAGAGLEVRMKMAAAGARLAWSRRLPAHAEVWGYVDAQGGIRGGKGG